jgi:hypothetical protein
MGIQTVEPLQYIVEKALKNDLKHKILGLYIICKEYP